MIISFGWTTPALLAGAKTVTRRDWNPKHAAKFHAGMLVDAWNTSPRNVKGNPHKVATIRLTQDVRLERTSAALWDDYCAEGFEYLSSRRICVNGQRPEELWRMWHSHESDELLYVVRFEVEELVPA